VRARDVAVPERAGERDRSRGPPRRAAVARGWVGEERVEHLEPARLAALELAPARSHLARGGDVAGVERREQPLDPVAVLAERDDEKPRTGVCGGDERPRRDEQVDPLRDDQLADEDDARAPRPRPPFAP